MWTKMLKVLPQTDDEQARLTVSITQTHNLSGEPQSLPVKTLQCYSLFSSDV